MSQSNRSIQILDRKRGGYPVIWEGKEYTLPGVTSVTGQLDKSIPLQYYAAEQAINYMREDFINELIEAPPEQARLLVEDLRQRDYKEIYKLAKKHHKKKTDEAADLGSMVHMQITRYLQGQKPILADEGIRRMFYAFLEFAEQYQVRPIQVEAKIASLKRKGYAGRFDYTCGMLIALEENKRGVVLTDIKTGKDIYEESQYQTAAYAHAWADMYEREVDGTGVILLYKQDDPEGKYKLGDWKWAFWDKKQTKKHYMIFLSLLDVWHRRHKK